MLKRIVVFIFSVFLINSYIWAQDSGFGFGFNFDEEGDEPDYGEFPSFGGGTFGSLSSGNSPSVSINGDVSAAVIGYFNEMADGASAINTRDMFMFSGKLKFHAQTSFAEAVINLKLVPALIPVSIDEAYIGAFFGGFSISAGLKKLAWGKADQMGPLDIINMPDASKLFIEMADSNNLMDVKIATPIIHASYRFGMFSKIEGVFLPSFEITSMAVSSAFDTSNPVLAAVIGVNSLTRWMPAQMDDLSALLKNGLYIGGNPINFKFMETQTNTLDYTQAGLRFTTTIGSVDIGVQYFYGRMFQPAVKFNAPVTLGEDYMIEFIYNTYHHIGLDYAQVLFGFNVRAEFAANITNDIKGDDGYIYNPSLGWSFGFDRDIFAGFNINFQANGNIRLMNDKVGSSNNFLNPAGFDIEAGKSVTSTRLTAMFSYKFMRDELELRTAFVWGIEDSDAAIIPSFIWAREDLRAALSGTFFLGDSGGQLGQYKDNNFLKISIAYVF